MRELKLIYLLVVKSVGLSHPVRVRELKSMLHYFFLADSVALYVGAWIEIQLHLRRFKTYGVAPYKVRELKFWLHHIFS